MSYNYITEFSQADLGGSDYWQLLDDFFKRHPKYYKDYWSIYLNYLQTADNNNEGLQQNQLTPPGAVFTLVAAAVDFSPNSFLYEDQDVKSGIIYDYINQYTENNPNPENHWNETWSEALKGFALCVYPPGREIYEGAVDTYISLQGRTFGPEYTHGSITTSAGGAFRAKDTCKSDAGANFPDITGVIYTVEDICSIYYHMLNADGIETVAAYGTTEYDCFYLTQEQRDLVGVWIDKTNTADIDEIFDIHVLNTPNAIGSFINSILHPPEGVSDPYKEAVKVKLTFSRPIVAYYKNPWVFPWTNSAGMSYSTVRDIDKIIGVLNSKKNLQFTVEREESLEYYMRLLMPKNIRGVEVEDLNRNFWVISQVTAAISAYLFDDKGPFNQAIKGSINEIMDMWDNIVNLWAAIAIIPEKPTPIVRPFISVIPLTASELQPFFKYDNFDVDISGLTVSNIRDIVEQRFAYLQNSMEGRNLLVLPEIRLNNYEHNYYSHVYYPGLMKIDRETNQIQWQDMDSINAFWEIDLTDTSVSLPSKVVGIRENSESEYKFIQPFNTTMTEEDNRRYYRLLRPTYGFEVDDNNVIHPHISCYDVAAALKNSNDRVVIWIDNEWQSDLPDLEEEQTIIPINHGYYQGELISYYHKLDTPQ